MNKSDFLNTIERSAFNAARRLNVPIVPKAVAAQAALESNWGKSKLAQEARNLFGVKATRTWAGKIYSIKTREWNGSRWVVVEAKFRQYRDWGEAVEDYLLIMKSMPWYEDALAAARYGDPYGFLYGLEGGDGVPGWATDPNYARKVLSIMLTHDLLNGPHPVWASKLYLNGRPVEVEKVSVAYTPTAGLKIFVQQKEVKRSWITSAASWLRRWL